MHQSLNMMRLKYRNLVLYITQTMSRMWKWEERDHESMWRRSSAFGAIISNNRHCSSHHTSQSRELVWLIDSVISKSCWRDRWMADQRIGSTLLSNRLQGSGNLRGHISEPMWPPIAGLGFFNLNKQKYVHSSSNALFYYRCCSLVSTNA